MSTFIKLTSDTIGEPIYVNVDFVTLIRRDENTTRLFFEDDEHVVSKETPEQIMQMIAQSQPPQNASPWELPRVWRDGCWRSDYQGQMFPPHWPSNREWGHWQELNSFDEAADALLRPMQTCQPSDRDKPAFDAMMKKAQEEPLDGPPDV